MADRFIRQLVTQSGVDTRTAVALALPSLDGKSAYLLEGARCCWYDCHSVAAADWRLFAYVAVEDAALNPNDDEWVMDVSWACQNTGGVAVALTVEPTKQTQLILPRATVQPYVYCVVDSTATAQANDVYFEVFYSIQKLSEIEYLRLLAGGA